MYFLAKVIFCKKKKNQASQAEYYTIGDCQTEIVAMWLFPLEQTP